MSGMRRLRADDGVFVTALAQLVGGCVMASLAVVAACAAEQHVRAWVATGNRREAVGGGLMWAVAIAFAFLALLIWRG